VLLKERYNPVIEQIRGRDRCLAIMQLGEANLGVGIDEGLLVDAANALQIADIECILSTAITRVLALELAVGLLLGLGFFECRKLSLGQYQAVLGGRADNVPKNARAVA
jgi:hypothetical protein